MTKSSVVDNETGKSIDSTVRTSTGTFFARGQNPVLAAVEKRIAQVGASQTFTHTSTPAWGSLVLQSVHSSCQHAKCMINQTPACQYLLHGSIWMFGSTYSLQAWKLVIKLPLTLFSWSLVTLMTVPSKSNTVFMQVSHIPEENGEGMQVLHYVNGQKYEPHHDYFHDTVNPQKSNGGQRVATMLMYLTTVEEGGETVFPNAAEKVVGDQWSDCAKRGLAVKTQKGDALLFFR